MTTCALRWTLPVSVAMLLTQCNTILDNKEGFLAMPEEAGPQEEAGTPVSTPDGSVQDPGSDAGSPIQGNPSCASNEQRCGTTCVAQDDPHYGCGQIDCTPCAMAHASAACNGRTCVMDTCNAGYADCNQQDTDGCETDLSKDIQNCGTCSNACPTSPNATVTCVGGTCQLACDPTFHLCGGACTPDANPSACGPTCEDCPAPANAVATCADNQCSGNCLSGFADCDTLAENGCEAVLATDPLNCGVCGVSCNGALCVDGKCQDPVVPSVDAGSPDAQPAPLPP
ncbi:MAG: hypothetical protein FWD69_08070 [Polyangiaceae bacterium]|nr:hypothetical protein [Polyangiaceae bacterium]